MRWIKHSGPVDTGPECAGLPFPLKGNGTALLEFYLRSIFSPCSSLEGFLYREPGLV